VRSHDPDRSPLIAGCRRSNSGFQVIDLFGPPVDPWPTTRTTSAPAAMPSRMSSRTKAKKSEPRFLGLKDYQDGSNHPVHPFILLIMVQKFSSPFMPMKKQGCAGSVPKP
jgi:hypothetical protein